MRRVLLLVSALCAGSVGQAEELRFDVRMHGVRAAELVVKGDVQGASYSVSGRARGTGLIGSIVEVDFRAQARGRVSNGRLMSSAVTLDDRMGDERGVTVMDWPGSAPRVTRSPGFPREAYDIDAADQRGAKDPMSALFDLLRTQPEAGLCNWRAKLFDGRRATQINVAPPQAVEGGLRCNAEFLRIAGFEPEDMARTRFPFSVTYAPAGDGMMRAVEMRAATKYGDAVLRRQ